MEGVGVEPERLRATRFSGPVSAPRRPHLPERTRDGNRTRSCALKERRPGPLDHPSSPASGWTRTSSPSFGNSGHVHVRRRCAFGGTRTRSLRVRNAAPLPTRPRRRSSPGSRTLPSGLEVPSPIHRASPASIGRESNPRFALCRRAPWPLGDRCVVQVRGLEPRSLESKASILPLDDT